MTPAALTTTETWSLLALSFACFGIIANTLHGDGEPLIASLAFSGIAFSASYSMIRWLGPTFMEAGLKGKDLSKVHKKEIPETMGAVCAVVYLLVVIVFVPFPFYKDIVAATSGGGNRDILMEVEIVEKGRFLHRFPHNKVCHSKRGGTNPVLTGVTASILPICHPLPPIRMHPGHLRRSFRYPLAA
jgi:UDP-N-acetylglucosamine--dolichyl-phosphate N-acetylglucosaminephosphotransferase